MAYYHLPKKFKDLIYEDLHSLDQFSLIELSTMVEIFYICFQSGGSN